MTNLKFVAIDLSTKRQRLVEPPSSSSGASYERTFTQADLSIAGVLAVTHGLGGFPSSVALWSASGEAIGADKLEVLTADAISVYLESFMPLQGTFTISITT